MLSNFSFSFADISEILAFALSVGGFLWAVFVWQGSKIFATKTNLETIKKETSSRFDSLEDKLKTVSGEVLELRVEVERLPSYQDIQNLNTQLAEVKTQVTSVNGKVDRVDAIATRLEHQLNLLIEHQLNKEK